MAHFRYPYVPGVHTHREFSGYSREQERLWRVNADLYYAHLNGQDRYRVATPGVTIDPGAVHDYVNRVSEEWTREARRQEGTRGILPADYASEQWQYVYERMVLRKYGEEPKQQGYSDGE